MDKVVVVVEGAGVGQEVVVVLEFPENKAVGNSEDEWVAALVALEKAATGAITAHPAVQSVHSGDSAAPVPAAASAASSASPTYTSSSPCPRPSPAPSAPRLAPTGPSGTCRGSSRP